MRIKLMLFFAILASFFVSTTHGYCSLEKMKTFAREACERLFQQDEGRERRSLDYSHHRHVNELMHGKSHKHEHFIGRSSFPKGGYLKVSKAHYHKLVNLDVKPRYKPRKHPEMKSRFRRDNSIQAYKGISYCCFHQCDEDFFC